jgi:DNA-binding transcriptional ArsR family regulator
MYIMKSNCCNCFKLVSTPQRFKIFNYLKTKQRSTVSELVRLTTLRQPTVTFHINQLAKCGFVKKIKDGRNVFCQIRKKCPDCPLFT